MEPAGSAAPKPKMDMSRAQCILGFTSSRWMDSSGGNDPKAALDKALFEQMKNVEKKKRPAKVSVP